MLYRTDKYLRGDFFPVNRRLLLCLFVLLGLLSTVGIAVGQNAEGDTFVTVMHYFTGELGREGLNQIFGSFQEKTGVTVFDNPIGHEDSKRPFW